MNYYSIGEFAKAVGKSVQTIRNWDKSGYLVPCHVSQGGHRYYSQQQLDLYLKVPIVSVPRSIVCYCRVSSAKQKDDLERQIDYVAKYCVARGYAFSVITDIGSGINYKKKGLKQLLTMICNQEVDKLIILYKDRLVRFGYELIQFLCERYCTDIEIIDSTEKTEQEELVEDLVQIITVFSCKLQGKRASKTHRMIDELTKCKD